MKRLNFIFIGLIIIFSSCSDMFEKHEEFIKNGETVYLSMIDSAALDPGNGRAKIKLYYKNKSSLDRTVIYWNQRKDSLVIDLSLVNPNIDSLTVLVDKIKEGAYEFEIINKNSFDDTSLPYDMFGNVFGEQYQSNLTHRIIKSKKYSDGETCIDWYAASETLIYTELIYLDKQSNKEQMVKIGNELQTIIESEISDFKYRCAYIPETAAIDTFYTNWSDDVPIL